MLLQQLKMKTKQSQRFDMRNNFDATGEYTYVLELNACILILYNAVT